MLADERREKESSNQQLLVTAGRCDTFFGGPFGCPRKLDQFGWHMGFNLLIGGLYWGYNQVTNHLLYNFLGHPSNELAVGSCLLGVSCELSNLAMLCQTLGKLAPHLAPTEAWWNSCGGVFSRVSPVGERTSVPWLFGYSWIVRREDGMVTTYVRISS